ncbi:MAG: MbcA/ParS/Xre antitoxin family protein, partial [Pseudomonadota bacterium]|nr:MbcA/ParS/Xre antitoxin family protein [Pseudomonadota bacterium]
KKDAKRKEPKHSFVQNKEIGALLQQASDMMQQDSDRAKIWFETKMDVFGGETPMQHAKTEKGAREVEDLVGRIRNGVFS